MNKIMKRLLTGFLTLATVFTTLPVTQIHAADSVYTTTDGKAGTIVKVDNGGTEIKSFEESIMTADGQIAYCVDINTDFKSGYKNRVDAKDRMSNDQISDVALNLEYVKQYSKTHSLSSKQVYLLEQCVVWRRLSVHLGWGYNNVRAAYDEVSEKIQSEVYENAKSFAKENKDRYDCGGYIYVGEGQDLGQFWAKLAVGNGKIQKSSSNATVTNGNDCYSLSGATYGVYSDKGCTKSVATLTTNASGNTDTVELRAATYYVKETKAPKGFQLDKNVYTMTVKAGETSTLKVSDTPKVTDTLVELFKIDMETSKATPQGNASLEGAEFVWKYYDGYYTKDNLPSEPTRTWTTKTVAEKDSNNEVHYISRLADSYKVSGDSFYTQNGTICLPLGTITMEEKAAPNGYLLEGAYMQATGSSEQIKGVYVAQITEDGELVALSGSNQYSVLDKHNEADKGGMGHTLYIGSFSSEVYFCCYEKNYEQYAKLGIPIEEVPIKNRFEIRLKNERAYYAVRELLTNYDAEQTAFSIINQYIRFADKEPDKRKSDWKTNARWSWFIGEGRPPVKLTTKPEPYTLERTLNWLQRQVAPTLKMLKKIDKDNQTDYLETIEQQARLTERHHQIIKQQTATVEDMIVKEKE